MANPLSDDHSSPQPAQPDQLGLLPSRPYLPSSTKLVSPKR